jgi:RNA polymerase sigma-70 factor (ECF subfamily)
MQSAIGDDRAAFVHLIDSFQDSIHNAILRIVGEREEARDLTQETFVRAREKISGYRGECLPYTWFLKIAVGLSVSQIRKLQRRRSFSLEGGQAASLARRAAADEMDTGDPQQLLWALGRLDAEYRAILVMRDVENLDYEQMADILSLPAPVLRTRLFRARLALHDGLAGPGKG